MARLIPWFFGIFALGVLMHLSWALALLDGDAALGATPLYALGLLPISKSMLIASLIIASLLAAWSIAWPIRSRWGIIALVPQQFFLLLSGGGAVKSVLESTYADGVLRPQWFILADQMPIILLMMAHTLGLLWIVTFEARRHA